MWTVGRGFVLLAWFWMLAGRERVILKSSSLVHRREIFGIGRSSEYDLAHITNLRVSPQSLNAWSRGANVRNWGLGGGIVAFDYGARTIRFGASIDEAEGSMIVNQLRQRYRFAETAG